MLPPLDIVGEGMMFLAVHPQRSFVCPFIWTDLVIAIYITIYEQLEQC